MQTPIPTLALSKINFLPGPEAPALINWLYFFILGVTCLLVFAAALGTFLGKFSRHPLQS